MNPSLAGNSVTTLIRSEDADETRLGMCGRYPSWMQRFATPRVFLIAFCIKNILQAMSFSYLIGIQTSLERHFKFDAKTIGLFLTLGEIGPILTAVWISHMGSSGNRPRWMGCGMMIIALGLLLAFGMNWIFPPPALEASEQFGYQSLNNSMTNQQDLLCHSASPLASGSQTNGEKCTIDSSQRRWAFAAWVFIYSLLGIGSTTVYTIGAPYLDDSIDNKNSPLYFGITIAVRGIGPVLGISLSSACVRLYVDLNSNPNFKSTDPRWVGAWWLGFLLLAVLLALYALVLAAFPRRLIPPNSKKDAAQVEAPPSATSTSAVKPKEDPGQSNFRNSLMRIIRNPLIICGCGSSIFSILGVVGYVIYLPKYFEHEFRVSKSKAGLFSGLSGSASMIFGVLLSGYVIGRCRPSARSVAAFVAVTKFVYAFGLLFIMLFNCGLENDLPGVLTANGSLTLGGSCSQDCYCNTEKFSPVCSRGSDGVNQTYFSPCHAGCSVETSVDNGTVYSDCRCGSDIETGFCQKTCSNMYIYMILLSIIKFIVSLSTVGNLIINLRCVNDGDKALALGILATAVALFGFLPNPIIYGAVIDSSCLVWEQSCGKRGSCWVYATDQFRYRLHGVTSGFLLIAGVFEVITYFQIKDLKLFDSRK